MNRRDFILKLSSFLIMGFFAKSILGEEKERYAEEKKETLLHRKTKIAKLFVNGKEIDKFNSVTCYPHELVATATLGQSDDKVGIVYYLNWNYNR